MEGEGGPVACQHHSQGRGRAASTYVSPPPLHMLYVFTSFMCAKAFRAAAKHVPLN